MNLKCQGFRKRNRPSLLEVSKEDTNSALNTTCTKPDKDLIKISHELLVLCYMCMHVLTEENVHDHEQNQKDKKEIENRKLH